MKEILLPKLWERKIGARRELHLGLTILFSANRCLVGGFSYRVIA